MTTRRRTAWTTTTSPIRTHQGLMTYNHGATSIIEGGHHACNNSRTRQGTCHHRNRCTRNQDHHQAAGTRCRKRPATRRRQGRRLLGLQLPAGPHRAAARDRRTLRGARHQGRLRPQELSVPQRHHHRLQRRGHGAGLCLQQPKRDLELRLRQQLHRLTRTTHPLRINTGPRDDRVGLFYYRGAY